MEDKRCRISFVSISISISISIVSSLLLFFFKHSSAYSSTKRHSKLPANDLPVRSSHNISLIHSVIGNNHSCALIISRKAGSIAVFFIFSNIFSSSSFSSNCVLRRPRLNPTTSSSCHVKPYVAK